MVSRMLVATLFPVEARRAVAADPTRYSCVSNGVRVTSSGVCPVSDLLRHPSVWDRLYEYRRERWKPVMDVASEVLAMLQDAGVGPQPEHYNPSLSDEENVEAYCQSVERFYAWAQPAVEELCKAWDTGLLDPNDLPIALGVGEVRVG